MVVTGADPPTTTGPRRLLRAHGGPMKSIAMTLSLAAAALLGACSQQSGKVTFSVSRAKSASALEVAGQDGTLQLADGTSTLVINAAEVVMREIELGAVAGTTDCTSEDCENEVETGPLLVSLPLDGSVAQQLAVDVP